MASANENAAGTVVTLTMGIDEATYLCDLLGALSGNDPYSYNLYNTLADCESIGDRFDSGRHFTTDNNGNVMFGEQSG